MLPQRDHHSFSKCGIVATLAALTLSGCPHAPLTYQLVPQGSGALLIPPSQILTANAPTFDVTIRNARRTSISNNSCDIEDELISLQWQGRTARIKVRSATYVAQPEEGAGRQSDKTMFLDPLQNLERFRSDLENLQSKNCLSRDESRRLRIALGEKLPLPPDAAYRFRFGSFELTGIFDLVSDFRLHITGPVYATSADSSTSPVIGFENAYYIFTPTQNRELTHVSLASVTETDRRKDPVTKSKPQNTLAFPESSGYFRIVFRTDAAASERISIATLLSAPDENSLAEATRQLASGPADSCEAVIARGANCMMFPPRVGVGIELGVHVNGRQVFVGIGGSLSRAIRGDKPSVDIEKTLQVRRLYQGHLIPVKFDPASQAIFGLVLLPGDEITW